ncbi:MAG: hypothetical protein ABR606_06330 [Vicinamibacterales bacterium]
MDALDATERSRHRELVEQLVKARVGVVELADGFAFQFTSDDATFAAAAEWVTYEGRCCPSLGFVIEWRDATPITVRLTGEPGAKQFIAETFATLTQSDQQT